ncbi:MAG: hypothetical protein RML45_01535 [Acetobacteraceae bacterium]|nr:hypothetical protein [Acetobacteraceae bacterium]
MRMPLRARRPVDDLARFALLDAAALGVAAILLAVVRLRFGDGRDAVDPAGVWTVLVLTLAALGGSVLIAFSHRAWLAVLLCLASGLVLVSGASALLTLLLPKTYAALGPAAMAFMLVLLGSIGAVPLGLLLRALV